MSSTTVSKPEKSPAARAALSSRVTLAPIARSARSVVSSYERTSPTRRPGAAATSGRMAAGTSARSQTDPQPGRERSSAATR